MGQPLARDAPDDHWLQTRAAVHPSVAAARAGAPAALNGPVRWAILAHGHCIHGWGTIAPDGSDRPDGGCGSTFRERTWMDEEAPLELDSSEIAEVGRVLARACGLSLTQGLDGTLCSGVAGAAAAMKVAPAELVRQLRSGDAQSVALLIEHSVVGESSFWRYPEQFAALRRHLFDSPAPLRIWSAGCASGEEPYSLAMALLEAGRPAGRDRILATDVSEHALAKARAGRYAPWALRRLAPALRDRYFTDDAGSAVVLEAIKSMVELRQGNLIADPADPDNPSKASEFDAILCRNVLIYFEPATVAEVLHQLVRALRPGGYLVLGPIELPFAAPLWIDWIESDGATLLQKPANPERTSPRIEQLPSAPTEPLPSAPPRTNRW
jgi:chemotaxis protein methyltransferase CheR